MPALSSAARAASTERSLVCTSALGEVAGLDARAIADPLVVRLDEALEPGVGHEPRRERAAHPGDGGVARHGAELTAVAAASGDPTASALAPGTTRLAIFVSTSPGPHSRKVVAPAAASACASSYQRTGEITWRSSSERSSASVGDERAAHVLGDRERRLRELERRRARRGSAARPAASAASGTRPPPAAARPGSSAAAASASARSIAATDPLITDCTGELRFATSSTSSPRASSQSASASSGPAPSSAVIVPGRASPARCMASPRTTTTRSAPASGSTPAATRAENSPSECPAAPDDAREPLGFQHPERRDAAGEQGRLHELGRRERRLVVGAGDHVATHRLAGFLEHGAPGRVRRPGVGHALELRALPREDHRDRHGRRAYR